MTFISKSTFVQGLQCPKLLWFRYNAKAQFPPVDEAQQTLFDQGKEVGDLAKRLFPDGVEIKCDHGDYDRVLKLTQRSLALRKPLFEAGFACHDGFARVDIMEPAGKDAWNLIEVKSSTEAKDVYRQDIAFQAHVLNGAELKLERCFLLLINNDYVRQGPIDPKQLFTRVDVTAKAAAMGREVEARLDEMRRTVGLTAHPEIKIGPHCDDPYPCPLHDHCWAFLPENNVFALYRGKKKAFGLLDRGIQTLAAIPEGHPLTANQQIQKQAAVTGEPHVDRAAIAIFLGRLKHPVSYLDFETFNTAIPLFDGCRPFQQVPFQFSLHIVRSAGATPEHHAFLAEGRDDPTAGFLARLRQVIPDSGSIVAYSAAFEQGVLNNGGARYPEFQPWVKSVERRIVDLLQPFRGFRYYHPAQEGSASMKAVLPALTGETYDHLAIQEGGTASREFLRVTFSDVSEEERQTVRRNLEAYCGQDTRGMISIVERLAGMMADADHVQHTGQP